MSIIHRILYVLLTQHLFLSIILMILLYLTESFFTALAHIAALLAYHIPYTTKVLRQKSFVVFMFFACPQNFFIWWCCSSMDLRESTRDSAKVILRRSACTTCRETFMVYGNCKKCYRYANGLQSQPLARWGVMTV